MERRTILHIEDDEATCKEVSQALGVKEFDVVCAPTGRDGLEKAKELKPDLILLDLILPEMDGLEVCRRIRDQSNTPIIMLTVKGEEVDRVVGLEIGADDYIAKPFSPRELVARVRAMVRRSVPVREPAERQKTVTFPRLVIDLPTRTVRVDDEEVHLTPREFDLIYHLASHPRRVFSRQELREEVWGYPTKTGDLRTVDTHIKRLRKKLEEGRGELAWRLATVWGVGYKFDVSA